MENPAGAIPRLKVPGLRKDRRLNVFVICVESLSADFLARFGQKKNLIPFYEDKKLVILSPGKKVHLMENPETENRIKTVESDGPFSLTAIAYYQGADYILKHKMNRLP